MEIMKYVCPIILFIFSVLAVFYACIIGNSEHRKETENRLLVAFCISSAIWSVGFGALILQTDTEWAYRCRVIGMVGTILYLVTGQMLISYLSGIRKKWTRFFDGFAGLGVIVYFLTVERGQTIYQLDKSGMTYSFKPGIANSIYTAYSLILAFLMFGIALYMCFSKTKRIRFFGKIFIIVDLIMLLGTVLDTVFPLMGIPAIPGSTMTQFLGVVVLYMAITANNRSKINIANMSEFIYYSLSMPVLVYDANGYLQIANDEAAKFLGIERSTMVQQKFRPGMHFKVEDTDVFAFEGMKHAIDCACISNGVYCNLAISKIADRYDDIIGYIIIVTDLSERMKNLQRLEEAKQEAEAANRSKSAFLANMSHEIRTPMNAILGFSELALKKNDTESMHEYVQDIRNSCMNLLAVINDILDISKLDSGKAELSCSNYKSAALLQEVYHMIDIQAKKKGLVFEMNTDAQIPNELYGDKTRIRGILINILSNAVKYTEQGSVTFDVNVKQKKEDEVLLQFAVKDTGIGLKQSSMEHMFDSFTRFDSQRNSNIEGTGLGLAIVNGYVKLMGGTIEVDSVYGQGSTFTVTLLQKIVDASPINLTQAVIRDENALNADEIKIKDTRVLVTDDNHINLKVIKNTLEYYGLMVDTAASGAEAMELCENNSYDLIFMDQMMPVMDGVETMQRLRKKGVTAKIIALTANAILGVREELLEEGFDEYLSKPIQFRELDKILRRFIATEKIQTQKEGNCVKEEAELSLEEMFPYIDVVMGLEYCMGDKDVYMEILKIFYEQADGQLADLQKMWKEKDYKNYIVQIHGLKTQLLNIGYSSLAEEARALEFAGKEERYDYIEDNQDNFIEAYIAFKKQLEVVF